jgi:DNA-directed RNA polymerase sigma subunit (sigma70/sigma32)
VSPTLRVRATMWHSWKSSMYNIRIILVRKRGRDNPDPVKEMVEAYLRLVISIAKKFTRCFGSPPWR